MKENSKKVPDAPKRLWVCTYSLIHDSGLMAVGNISFREYWVGHKNKVPKNVRPWSDEEEEEYISLSQSWHKTKEVPEDLHTFIIGVSKNFTHPVLINLEKSCIHTFYDALNISDKMKWNGIIRKNFRFAYWAYIIGKEDFLHHLLIKFPGSGEIRLHIAHGNLVGAYMIQGKTNILIVGSQIILRNSSPGMAKCIRSIVILREI